VDPLRPSECASYLAEVPDWELRNEGRIVARRFRFPDYRTALAFTNAVSALAEEI
jgi:4a-hydroxytetrahydrobiopterin dehydratase